MSADREPMHVPVLPAETLALLDPQPGEIWVDCTTGGGGHARLIAEMIGPTGRLIGLDQDPTALERASPRLAGLPVTLVHANFDQLAEVLEKQGLGQVDGVLADIGFSSDQLGDPTRGLSFMADGPLDMRLDPTAGTTAADLVNGLPERELADVLFEFGEERKSFRVAKRIVERRKVKRFETTAELAATVRSCLPRSGGIDPATRTFQALRIAVNDELGALDRLLAVLPTVLKQGGRAGIISFHSLEDRRVKQAFRDSTMWTPRTKKPVEAGEAETASNPRARSAKLRVAERK
ncbi:MAG: 16S rRNA (cytosine(1402)-N(4))-methyltransferase RsmH [Fimbriiglobus sp.]|jgi:16S rRNA (cytosine1402-N4)-methyltransferase|nr:16S rRNA (cytosine(1402)-N(4))-methyltransferase RsmH [Fimbriiglobus sp.]